MRKFRTALGLSSFLAVAGATLMAPTVSNAQPAGSYVACNQYDECWRVHERYAYGADAPITYYTSDWYDAHHSDARYHWLADPADDRGYYDHDMHWHADPGARALTGGAAGAGIGAAVGAAVGGGTGAVAGAASTPHD